MLTIVERATIFNLLDANVSLAEISRRTGKSIGTIKKYREIQKNIQQSGAEETISKSIIPVKDFIDREIRGGKKNVSKLYKRAIIEGYTGSYAVLNAYIRTHHLEEKYTQNKRSQQVQTGPGDQAQVDWGSFGQITLNGRREKLYAFVFVMSYSRAIYVEFAVRQNQQAFQNCHINAFKKLGIPKRILYDNMKTVVLSREYPKEGPAKIHFNPAFLDFCKYYDFEPDLSPRFWPRSKGKVEAGVKYLRHNFFEGERQNKTFSTVPELNERARDWVEKVAQQRIHKGTKQKPEDLWEQEKEHLVFPVTLPPYVTAPFLARASTKDGLVQYKGCHYAIPMEYARRKLFVREVQNEGPPSLEIYYKELLVATYPLSNERGRWVLDNKYEVERSKKTKKVGAASIVKINTIKDTEVKLRDLSYYDELIRSEERSDYEK